jgi:hypothetical protein
MISFYSKSAKNLTNVNHIRMVFAHGNLASSDEFD